MPLRRALAGGLLPMLLGLPLPSAAAAPSAQAVLNNALLKEWAGQPTRQDTTINVGVKQTAYKKTDPSGSAKLGLHLKTRTVPVTGSVTPDQEGSLSLDSLSVDSALSEGLPVSLDGPLGVQWKLVDRTAYFQLSQLPPSIIELGKEFSGTDYSALVGRWIKIDLADEGVNLPENADIGALKTLAMKAPPLLVTRVESKTKNAGKDDIWRLRLRVNPAFVNGLYTLAWNKLPKSPAATRSAAIKQLNTDFANLRSFIARTGVVAVVDATTQTLTRFELGGSYPSPAKQCAYDDNFNETCRTSGTRTVTLAVGINISHDDGSPVSAPADALDQAGLEALLESLQPQDATGTLQEIDETQTLTAAPSVSAVDSLDHVRGSANAKVTVITYSDFACPFCQRMDPDLDHLLTDFPNDVRLVYREFPLAEVHPSAQSAAEAAECAAEVGGNDAFWQMHDKLMLNPALQNRDGYLSFASQIGLDGTAFATCIDTHAQAGRVQRDLDSGRAADVNGTPTSFINGEKLEGAVEYSMLKDAVVRAGALR
ncbi:MAG TPA: thioredoxin domain-containing protein [Verrucomicrobiae bacterium]|nr:thioredoxin domain-containing protein [Verrucomicrobiae bacterium]